MYPEFHCPFLNAVTSIFLKAFRATPRLVSTRRSFPLPSIRTTRLQLPYSLGSYAFQNKNLYHPSSSPPPNLVTHRFTDKFEMAAADVQAPPAEPTPALPDYVTDPDAVLRDSQANWRYGKAPDYSKTRKVFAESKSMISSMCSSFATLLAFASWTIVVAVYSSVICQKMDR